MCSITIDCAGSLTDGTITVVLAVDRALVARAGSDLQRSSVLETAAAIALLPVLMRTEALVVLVPLDCVDRLMAPTDTPSAAASWDRSVSDP